MLRFLLYSCIVILAYACGSNDTSKSGKDIQKADYTTKPQVNPKPVVLVNTAVYYDSLRKRLKGTEELPRFTRMRLAFQDFYSYVTDLRTQFYKFAGDNEGKQLPAGKDGDVNLTNQYFIEQGYAADLYGNMEKVQFNLPPRATPREDMLGLIETLNPGESVGNSDDFLNRYFKNVPARAADGILNAFELKIKGIESKVLVKYAEINGITKQLL
jgi:hypothetical protein